MPETPISESAARTSSSLKGLIMAVINFILNSGQSWAVASILLRLHATGTAICEPTPFRGGPRYNSRNPMLSTIVIIGGGQAGAQAIDPLRREGFGGRLVLIGDEPELPYQRPPLSKKYLSGEMAADRLLFRHQSFYD